jgi:long-chain acyl-CoA synthetase
MSNLVATLRTAALEQPGRVAVRAGTTEIGYSELWAAAGRFGRRLRDEGITVGDRVALAMPTIPRFAVAYHGALLAGAVAVPLNAAHPGGVLAEQLRDAGARLLVVAQGPPPAVREAAEAAEVALCEFTDAAAGGPELEPEPVDDDGPAVIAYKATDVDEPIGVVLSHHNLAWSAAAAAGVLGLSGADTLATHFPPFHPLGQTYGLNAAVAAGATLALPTVDAASPLDVVRSAGATVLSTFPMLISTVVGPTSGDHGPGRDAGLRSLRTVFSSGGRNLAPRARARLAGRFGCEVLEGYGTPETSGLACAARSGEPPCPGSMGRPVPGVELAVVDSRGREAAPHKAGGLIARGPNVTTGYWQRAQDTRRAFDHGWLITGEKARQDRDGNVFLLDDVWWTDPLRGREAGREGLVKRGLRALRG